MAEPKWAKSQDGSRVKMSCCCLLSKRVELTVNSKKVTNGRVKMSQGSKWAKSQNGPRVKMGYCFLPPERVELTVNSKKETNSRVKMGQGSRWAAVVEISCQNNRVKLGQKESAWAWVNLGLAHFDSESDWAKESIWVGTCPLDLFLKSALLTKMLKSN